MFIPENYMDSIEAHDRMALYQKMANAVPTTIIRATNDETLGLTRVNEVRNAVHRDIAASHNFAGEGRQKLLKALRMNIL